MSRDQRTDGRTTDTRERVLRAARRRFTEQGFAATSLRDIADELGITKAALYYHFPRKADLVREVLAPMADDIDAWFDQAEASDATTRELLTDYFDVVRHHHDLIIMVTREPATLEIADIGARVAHWVVRAQRVFSGPNADLEARVRTTLAIGGLARVTSFLEVDDDVELRRLAVQAALDALGVPEQD